MRTPLRRHVSKFMSANSWFVRQLKSVLASLYNPAVLRSSSLAELFNSGQQADQVASLRLAVLEGIESLQPTRTAPLDSRAWRVYQILRRRYAEGLSQRQVASDLGLSVRQLQREEKLAREMLADHLWIVHSLEGRTPLDVVGEPEEEDDLLDEGAKHALEEELAWLQNSVPVQLTDVDELIQEVLTTVEPLLRMPEVTVIYQPEGGLRVPLRAAILRQALLDVTSIAIHYAQDGQLQVHAELLEHEVLIHLDAVGGQAEHGPEMEHSESLAMASQLIQLCDGCLEITLGSSARAQRPAFEAKILLPVPEHVPVLVIDDNADALQLLERYLANSRYLFIGTQDARHALGLAVEVHPRAILLDVMMPERDGWVILGQLREHPETGRIPVVVCTILSQRELALALGAAGFIRKPVNRGELLSMLDRLVAHSPEPL